MGGSQRGARSLWSMAMIRSGASCQHKLVIVELGEKELPKEFELLHQVFSEVPGRNESLIIDGQGVEPEISAEIGDRKACLSRSCIQLKRAFQISICHVVKLSTYTSPEGLTYNSQGLDLGVGVPPIAPHALEKMDIIGSKSEAEARGFSRANHALMPNYQLILQCRLARIGQTTSRGTLFSFSKLA